MKTKMKSFGPWAVALVLISALVLSACNAPFIPTQNLDDAVQKAMQTLQAQATLEAFQTMVAHMTSTPGSLPGETPTVPAGTALPPTPAPPTQVPTVAITIIPPTATRVPPTATVIPPSPTPKPCNRIEFVSDVTIPMEPKSLAAPVSSKPGASGMPVPAHGPQPMIWLLWMAT